MTKGQKFILILLALWWLISGIIVLANWEGIEELFTFGLVATIPLGIIFWIISPKKHSSSEK